jgi:hypothetical protein
VLKNKHQVVSQDDYGLEAWRLGGWNARRLKKGINGFASSFPASQLPSL